MKKLIVGAASLAVAGLIQLAPASAAEVSIVRGIQLPASEATQVRFRRCVEWHRVCRYRWGFGTWRYRRCMARHGCL